MYHNLTQLENRLSGKTNRYILALDEQIDVGPSLAYSLTRTHVGPDWTHKLLIII